MHPRFRAYCLNFSFQNLELFDFHSLVNLRYISIRPSAIDRLAILTRSLLQLPTLEIAVLTFSVHHRDAVRQLLTPRFVQVLEDFGAAPKSHKLCVVIYMKKYSECPPYMVGSNDIILASDEGVQEQARHSIKRFVARALPICVRRGVLDVTVHFDDDPYSQVMGSLSFGALQCEHGEFANEKDIRRR